MAEIGNYTEVRWGRDGDFLVVEVASVIPDEVAVGMMTNDITPVVREINGRSSVEYDMRKIHKDPRAPLDLIADELLEPLRQYARERNLGRVAFKPELIDIKKGKAAF